MTDPIRTLSSMQTFFVKVVFPAIWIGGFGIGTAMLFFAGDAVRGKSANPPPPGMKWIFLAVWLVGSTFIYWFCIRLKRVQLSDSSLFVSNFLERVEVPLTDVIAIRENRWVNSHPVTVTFRGDTPFGAEIVFIPKVRLFSLWTTHPVVAELQEAVNRARGRAAGHS